MRFELMEYKKACDSRTCNQPYDNTFIGLHKYSNGNVCETGCPYFNDGKCPGYLELKGTALINEAKPKPSKYTNADLAKKWGISKRQVSKIKRDNPVGFNERVQNSVELT